MVVFATEEESADKGGGAEKGINITERAEELGAAERAREMGDRNGNGRLNHAQGETASTRIGRQRGNIKAQRRRGGGKRLRDGWRQRQTSAAQAGQLRRERTRGRRQRTGWQGRQR